MGLFSKSKKASETTPEVTYGTSKPAATDESTSTSTPRLFSFGNNTSDAKEAFVSTQASVSSKQSGEDKPRKKSFYQKYQELKRGPGIAGLSDEELKRYTGKTREEMDIYAKTTPGVAGGQAAGSLTAGGTSGFGMAGGAGEGLGGWGFEAGKRPTVR